LAEEHAKAHQFGKRQRDGALRFVLRFDKFMRVPGVYTMCARTQMWNLIDSVATVLRNDVPGDLLEAGAWRGGMGMLMKEILRRNGDTTRTVWLADAWSGRFPTAEAPNDAAIEAVVYRLFADGPTRDDVIQNFKTLGLWDSRLQFIQGYFEQTLPNIAVERLAVLRLDADFYNSTLQVLTHLYPKLSPGGFIIVDDYGIPGCDCKKAVDEYRSRHKIIEIKMADSQCAYWQKS
jgi:hypothetical protein